MADLKDFFVTYNGRDEDWATWIAGTLESAGYSVTIQAWDFRPGDNFMAKMNDALANSRHTLGVMSPNYLASLFTQAEWTAAYRKTLMGQDRAFIPVMVAKCDVAPLLGPVVYIDLVDVDDAEARDRLLSGVAPTTRTARRKPSFPGGPPTSPGSA